MNPADELPPRSEWPHLEEFSPEFEAVHAYLFRLDVSAACRWAQETKPRMHASCRRGCACEGQAIGVDHFLHTSRL